MAGSEKTPEQLALIAKMDAAAEVAAKELKKLDKGSVEVVAKWMKTNFASAGYKRLARLLTNSVKE